MKTRCAAATILALSVVGLAFLGTTQGADDADQFLNSPSEGSDAILAMQKKKKGAQKETPKEDDDAETDPKKYSIRDIGPQPVPDDGMWPSKEWRLGWPMGKKFPGCEELNGLYHAASIKKIGKDRYEWYYDFKDENQLLDWLEIDGFGEKGYGEIRDGKLHVTGRRHPETVLRSGYYLNAVLKIRDTEIEFRTKAAGDRGGVTLANFMACPLPTVWGTPYNWDLEKFMYPDKSTHYFHIEKGRAWISSGTFKGSGKGGHDSDRHVHITWKGSTITMKINDKVITREGKENIPRNHGRDMCLAGFGVGGKKGLNAEPHIFYWVKIRGTLDTAWLHKTQKYGLPPRVNCARAAGERHGGMRWQTGSSLFRRHRKQLGGPEAQWKWLKANTTNYLYYSMGITDAEWEQIKAGGKPPKSIP